MPKDWRPLPNIARLSTTVLNWLRQGACAMVTTMQVHPHLQRPALQLAGVQPAPMLMASASSLPCGQMRRIATPRSTLSFTTCSMRRSLTLPVMASRICVRASFAPRIPAALSPPSWKTLCGCCAHSASRHASTLRLMRNGTSKLPLWRQRSSCKRCPAAGCSTRSRRPCSCTTGRIDFSTLSGAHALYTPGSSVLWVRAAELGLPPWAASDASRRWFSKASSADG
mmetsp:Transcript_106282/g.298993  ORF Transcript_106282/g.298993 Transcript_106282/m.298993 type:complete len:226 (-) Transcript_106282:461-1138(-)